MATFLLSRSLLVTGSLTFGLGLGLLHSMRARPIQCQYTAPYYNQHASPETGWSLANVPAAAKQGRTTVQQQQHPKEGGFLTASLMRQVSLGSVLGVVAGLGLRVFSRALVFFLGVGIVLVEWAASKGYHLLPLNRLQRLVKGVDVKRAVTEHVPFKASFGATMAMAAFAQF